MKTSEKSSQKTKTIQQVLAPPDTHWVGNGFRVHNFFPSGYNMPLDRMSPFFLLDYNSKYEFTASITEKRGVGVHPHRGFETVTLAYQGEVAHHDSAGSHGTIHPGDLQWMTAASGVLHKEYHSEEFAKKGGIFQMVQLWINLPAKYKMNKPQYQAIINKEIPVYKIDGDNFVEVIAGELNGVKGIAKTFSPIEMYNLKLKKGRDFKFSLPQDFNTGLLVIEGKVSINDTKDIHEDHFIIFENDGEEISVHAENDCIVLVLSGEPLNEPIAPHGPFVMNTREEIMQAFKDLEAGKFGYLED